MSDIDFDDEDEDFDEPADTAAELERRIVAAHTRPPAPAPENPPDPTEIARAAEETERKAWEKEAQDEMIREASLRAWEKERLADADAREARLVPLEKVDPFAGPLAAPLPRLAQPKEKSARRYARGGDAPDDVEVELAAVIAECRYFMREMAFESARLTPLAADRLRFIDSARSLAETSAKVGESVASVRHPLPAEPEERKRTRR